MTTLKTEQILQEKLKKYWMFKELNHHIPELQGNTLDYLKGEKTRFSSKYTNCLAINLSGKGHHDIGIINSCNLNNDKSTLRFEIIYKMGKKTTNWNCSNTLVFPNKHIAIMELLNTLDDEMEEVEEPSKTFMLSCIKCFYGADIDSCLEIRDGKIMVVCGNCGNVHETNVGLAFVQK